ncbi:hypothetical protein ACIPEN_21015 [Herbaspirillum chlorophenolicum]|uniref:Transmembrane protein n=1 Tax=Herbaspirillum chlorophenolicum TaxID=211589 RepID=A0ABW8F4V5_9BURK
MRIRSRQGKNMPTSHIHSNTASIGTWRQRAAYISHAMDTDFTWLAGCIMLVVLCLQLAGAGNTALFGEKASADMAPVALATTAVPPGRNYQQGVAADEAPQLAGTVAAPSCNPQRDAALQSHFMLLHQCTVERPSRTDDLRAESSKRKERAIKRRMT